VLIILDLVAIILHLIQLHLSAVAVVDLVFLGTSMGQMVVLEAEQEVTQLLDPELYIKVFLEEALQTMAAEAVVRNQHLEHRKMAAMV
jgi:hypothetical protein